MSFLGLVTKKDIKLVYSEIEKDVKLIYAQMERLQSSITEAHTEIDQLTNKLKKGDVKK